MQREATPDPLQGRPEPEVREALLGWLRVSGRVRRYLAAPPVPRGLAVLARMPGGDGWAEQAWAALIAQDQQATELYRHHAVLTAVAWARGHGVSANDADRQQAERDIAAEHGVESFPALQSELAPFPEFLAEVDRYRDLLGVAKRVRAMWFETGALGRATD
jgi:hypothetical protein